MNFTYHIDPSTGNFVYHDSDIQQGDQHYAGQVTVDGDSARSASMLTDDKEVTWLPEGTILENTLFFPHVKKAFVEEGLEKKTFLNYEVRDSEIHTVTYTLADTRKLKLAGEKYEALEIERFARED